MSTVEHNRLIEGIAVDIVSAAHIGDYVLRLQFNDGTSRDVDFESFLRASSNADVRSYLDTKKFGNFTLKDGELVWGDYELCFPIADLYGGSI